MSSFLQCPATVLSATLTLVLTLILTKQTAYFFAVKYANNP